MLNVSDLVMYEEAAEKTLRQDAMKEEFLTIQKNQMWDLVDLPKRKKSIGLKWVFKTNYNYDGSFQKHKVGLLTKGYSQLQGIDFKETFSPVAQFETVTTFIVVATQLGWSLYQLKVKAAFLNGELSEEVYVSQPEELLSMEMKTRSID